MSWSSRAPRPLAAGVASPAAVVGAAVLAGAILPASVLRLTGGLLLLAFALWLFLRGAHTRWVGVRLRARDLVLWSVVMTTAHGAGLMLLPAVLGAPVPGPPAGGHAHHVPTGETMSPLSLLAVHTGAMLATMAVAAIAAHWLLGVGFLRRRWINLR